MWVGITYAADKWRGRTKKKSRMKRHYLRLSVQPRWAASMTAAPAVESLRLDPIQHIYSFSSHWKLNLCILYRRARAECENLLVSLKSYQKIISAAFARGALPKKKASDSVSAHARESRPNVWTPFFHPDLYFFFFLKSFPVTFFSSLLLWTSC